jgi:hypothetical protein
MVRQSDREEHTVHAVRGTPRIGESGEVCADDLGATAGHRFELRAVAADEPNPMAAAEQFGQDDATDCTSRPENRDIHVNIPQTSEWLDFTKHSSLRQSEFIIKLTFNP